MTSISTSSVAEIGSSPNSFVKSYQHALASQAAAAVSTLLFNPLEVVRVRFMAQDGTALRTHNGVRYATTNTAYLRIAD